MTVSILPSAAPLTLEQVLSELPDREVALLADRIGVESPTRKRIPRRTQLARAIVSRPELRNPAILSEPANHLLFALARAEGALTLPRLPAASRPLVERGLVFVREHGDGVQIILPIACYLRLPRWPAEDPSCLRALLTQVPPEVVSNIIQMHTGRRAPPPFELALEQLWIQLTSHEGIAATITEASDLERRLLMVIDGLGGEVDTEELLELEQEPFRLRSTLGASPTRRGPGYALERRGLLLPLAPRRHVMPREVAAVVGAPGRERQRGVRTSVRQYALAEDHAPRRARFAKDPALLSTAMALLTPQRARGFKDEWGTPRSLLQRLAKRFGRDLHEVQLIASLSRGLGLWNAAASDSRTPPGSWLIGALRSQLFQGWLRGAFYDEAREDHELLRAPSGQRVPSGIRRVREIVIDALLDLADGRWVPWGAVLHYVEADSRARPALRSIQRWAKRFDLAAVELAELARRITLQSLPALGILDIGDDDETSGAGALSLTQSTIANTGGGRDRAVRNSFERPLPPGPARRSPRGWSQGDDVTRSAEFEEPPSRIHNTSEGLSVSFGPALRVTRWGRECLGIDESPAHERNERAFREDGVFSVKPTDRFGEIVALAPFVEVGSLEPELELHVTRAQLDAAVARGVSVRSIRQLLSRAGTLSESVEARLEQAGRVIGKAEVVGASGFLWVDDPDVLERLKSSSRTRACFVSPSPPGGLLVSPGVDREELLRRCRALNVEVTTRDGQWFVRHRAREHGRSLID